MLEDKYPEHNRRADGWELVGFMETVDKPKNYAVVAGSYYNQHYPYGKVPIWRKVY